MNYTWQKSLPQPPGSHLSAHKYIYTQYVLYRGKFRLSVSYIIYRANMRYRAGSNLHCPLMSPLSVEPFISNSKLM
jgi:hypothetical protein